MKKSQKIAKNFNCQNCDYVCSKRCDYEKHLLTLKHNFRTNLEQKVAKNQTFRCKFCDKFYSARNSLWYHEKKCIGIEEENDTQMKDTETLIQYLLKENTEFKQLMIEQNKHMVELAKNAGTNNNNTTNNHFNLNFFLQETCKNAMNIMDFVNQLQIGVDDLEETGTVGFANGISKIFINGLKQIDVTYRPVHCSDPKRETLYIKNNDEWNKEDDDRTTLTNAIKRIANKNMRQISEWTKQHPGYNDSESKYNDQYLKIVSEAMSGSTKEETNKNYNRIIKNIIKNVVIEKNLSII